jgi:hypothetical protein
MKKLVILFCILSLAALATAQADMSLPAGTALKVKLETTLTTFSNKSGDAFSGRVTEAVLLDGKPVLPIGTTVQGRVIRTSEPRRVAGKPTIDILPETVVLPSGERYTLNATLVDTNAGHGTDVNEEGQFKGPGHETRDMAEIGAGTGGGMLLGGLIGGGKGVVIGGLIGATVTVTHWLSKKNSAMLPAGTELTMELSRHMALTAAATGGQ